MLVNGAIAVERSGGEDIGGRESYRDRSALEPSFLRECRELLPELAELAVLYLLVPQHPDRFVAEVLERIRAAGYSVCNVDVIIHAERPRLAEHKPHIKASLAKLLGLPADAVAVKATTNEGHDAVGRGEAIACWAAVLLARDG